MVVETALDKRSRGDTTFKWRRPNPSMLVATRLLAVSFFLTVIIDLLVWTLRGSDMISQMISNSLIFFQSENFLTKMHVIVYIVPRLVFFLAPAVITIILLRDHFKKLFFARLEIHRETESGTIRISWRKMGHQDVWVQGYRYVNQVPNAPFAEAAEGNPRVRIANSNLGEDTYDENTDIIRAGHNGYYGFILYAPPSLLHLTRGVILDFKAFAVRMPAKAQAKSFEAKVSDEADRIMASTRTKIDKIRAFRSLQGELDAQVNVMKVPSDEKKTLKEYISRIISDAVESIANLQE